MQRPGSTNLETYNSIAALGRTVKTVDCDLADLAAVRTLFARALEIMDGQIHILVNCAGIQRRSPAVSFSEQDWDDVRTSPFEGLCFISYESCTLRSTNAVHIHFAYNGMCRATLLCLTAPAVDCLLAISVFSPSLAPCMLFTSSAPPCFAGLDWEVSKTVLSISDHMTFASSHP